MLNITYAHVLAAEVLQHGYTKSLNNNNTNTCKLSDINGEVIHVTDFDANYIEFYRKQLNNDNSFIISLPVFIAYFTAVLYDFFVLVVYKLFGIVQGDPLQVDILFLFLIYEHNKKNLYCLCNLKAVF